MFMERDSVMVESRRDQDICILLFVKYPEEGRVKRRLSPELDGSVAAEVYRNFVADLLIRLEAMDASLCICFSPSRYKERFIKWLGPDYSYMPQVGMDLGERMRSAFIHAFGAGFDKAVLMGSDSPDLPGDILSEALSSLEDSGAVIGPAVDGGYYLIGFRKDDFVPGVFTGIEWSTGSVFRETWDIMARSARKVHLLPEWRDVDTYDDLKDMFRRNTGTEFGSSRTMSYLMKLRL